MQGQEKGKKVIYPWGDLRRINSLWINSACRMEAQNRHLIIMATVATEKGLLTARAKLAVDKQQTNERTNRLASMSLSSRTLVSPSCAFSPVSVSLQLGWDACLTKWAGGSVFSRTEQGSAARGPCAGWAALLLSLSYRRIQREVGKDPWSLIPGGGVRVRVRVWVLMDDSNKLMARRSHLPCTPLWGRPASSGPANRKREPGRGA